MGILGMDRSVPNSAIHVHYKVTLKGNAPKESLIKSKETLDKKSAILNTRKSPINVSTEIEIIE
jgi:hypothetical protein